jgi:RNA polymerase sigma-70 factor (ECF subfamily)
MGVEQMASLGELILKPREQADPAALLAGLFDAQHQRLYRLARRLSRDAEEARDLVQETFLRAARRPAAVPGEAVAAEAWLVRVLVNLCRDRHRHTVVRREGRPFLGRPLAEADPEAAAVARVSVTGALARLPARRRAVVVLAELEGRETKEIARLLGITQVTVRWHLSAGRRELAEILSAHAAPEEVEP